MNKDSSLPDPAEAAQIFIEQGITLKTYELIQARRRERIDKFREAELYEILLEAAALYEHGKIVLALLRLNYNTYENELQNINRAVFRR